MRTTLRLLFGLLLLTTLATPRAQAREVTDMLGRKVSVPDRITKVVALAPPGTYLVYAIDPSLIAGLNFPLWENEKRYTVESFRRVPVIGGRVGEGRQLNLEVLLKIAPDVAVLWSRAGEPDALDREYERTFATLGVPVVYVRFTALRDYPAALRFMGNLLDRSERADRLCRYAQDVLDRIDRALASLPPEERVPVYYAEGPDGLATDGEGSMHTELIPIAGGRNVRQSPPKSMMGMEVISAEQLLLYDPAVILAKEPAARDRLVADARWRDLRAVKAGKVFLIPHVPFNWFDRPPSFMRLLGVQWLTRVLHPERFAPDLVAETRLFYRLFLGVELTDTEAKAVAAP